MLQEEKRMKKLTALLLALLLLLLCACGVKEGFVPPEEEGEEEETEAPERADEPKDESEDEPEAPSEEPEEEPEEEKAPEVPEAPEVPAEPEPAPVPDVSAERALYLQLLEEGLVPLDWNEEYHQMQSCSVLATEPAALEGAWGNPYGVTALILTDLNDDGRPELVLQAGEVEQMLYVFTVRDGAVHCTGSGYLDNQNGTCVLSVYRDEETGRTVACSEGGAGSGAGNYYFLYYTRAEDLSCVEAEFRSYDEYSEEKGFYPVYFYGDRELTEEEFERCRSHFYSTLTPVEVLEFTPLGTDPCAVLTGVYDAWTAAR